jgi:uncharacterized protein YbjT (DUF2867 family)
VGGECLKRLLASRAYGQVIVVARRNLGSAARSGKVRQVVVDFEHLDTVAEQLRADHVYCAIGTTIRKAGSQAAFRQVDFEYPRRLAQLARAQGASRFALVSALGASRASPFFYSRVKGELEDALQSMRWPRLVIVRPSLIAGERVESRPLERLAEHALRFAPRSWRAVAAADIAAALVRETLAAPSGTVVLESRDIVGAAA